MGDLSEIEYLIDKISISEYMTLAVWTTSGVFILILTFDALLRASLAALSKGVIILKSISRVYPCGFLELLVVIFEFIIALSEVCAGCWPILTWNKIFCVQILHRRQRRFRQSLLIMIGLRSLELATTQGCMGLELHLSAPSLLLLNTASSKFT